MSTDNQPDDARRVVDLAGVAAVEAWGRSQRLPPALAESIFDEIVRAPVPERTAAPAAVHSEAGLPADWWSGHAAVLAATMIASTRWAAA